MQLLSSEQQKIKDTKTYQANTRLRKSEKEQIESLAKRLDFSVSQLLKISAINYGTYLASNRSRGGVHYAHKAQSLAKQKLWVLCA